MSVLRQLNLLGQQRVDVPHIRMLESSIAADFDVLGGRIVAGSRPLVVRGFTLTNYTAGTPAVNVQLNVADAILMNVGASEAGTFLWVPSNRSAETLDSSINSRVSGGFTASQTNYIGLDLSRKADSDTSDLVQFLDANTLIEQPKTVPLARTLDYKIVISTVPFSAQPNIVPIAKIKTNSSNQVASLSTDVEDARNLAFRLGAGGDFPNRNYSFGWSDGRVEFNTVTGTTVNQFRGGDKIIQSQKDWMDAVMTRIWEIGGGENWYSPVADRNIRMARNPSPDVFTTTGDNFEFISGNLHWRGLSIMFENSNGTSVYRNLIADQLSDSPGLTDITAGQCLYVDLNRTQSTSLTVQKANLWQLGTPSIPGSRVIIAWCVSTGVIMTRESQYPVNTALQPATTTVVGGVKLSRVASTPATPIVIADTGGTIQALVANDFGLNVIGNGTGYGVRGQGGSTSGDGVRGQGGGSVGVGGAFVGSGNTLLTPASQGVQARGGATAPTNFSSRATGAGVYGEGGVNNAIGGVFRGGSNSNIGSVSFLPSDVAVLGVGSGLGEGVFGISSFNSGSSGVYGQGSDGVSARGVTGQGSGTATGVEGHGTGSPGVFAGAFSGVGVAGKGGTSTPNNFTNRNYGAGVVGEGNATNNGNGVVGKGGAATTNGSTTTVLSNVGVVGVGAGGAPGVYGVSAGVNAAYGVFGEGSDGFNAHGTGGIAKGTGAGVVGLATGTAIPAVTASHGVLGASNSGNGGEFIGVYGVRGTGTGYFHGVYGKGGNSGAGPGPVGGGYGVYGEGGDFNGSVSFNDSLKMPGANAGGVFTGSPTYGGVGVAGYGQGFPGGLFGYGGYFVGATHASGGSDGIISRGGQGSGTNQSGTGVTGYGGYAPGTTNGGTGGFFWGGFANAGNGGTGVVSLGGNPSSGLTGGRGGSFSGASSTAAGGIGGHGAQFSGGTSNTNTATLASIACGIYATGGGNANTTGGGITGIGGYFAGGPTQAWIGLDARAGAGVWAEGTFSGAGVIGIGGNKVDATTNRTSGAFWNDVYTYIAGDGAGVIGVSTIVDSQYGSAIVGIASSATDGNAGFFKSSNFTVRLASTALTGGTGITVGNITHTNGNIMYGLSSSISSGNAASAGINSVMSQSGTAGRFETSDGHVRGTIYLVPRSSDPSAPLNGDIWVNGSALKVRLNGVTRTVTVTP